MQGDVPLGGSRDIASILDEAVAAIPTVFGKLVWISSLRVADEYHYPDLEQVAPSCSINSALHDLHKRLFGSWLALNLEEQSKDFTEYLETLQVSGDPAELLLGPRQKLVPPGTKRAELYLFETDLAVVLELAER